MRRVNESRPADSEVLSVYLFCLRTLSSFFAVRQSLKKALHYITRAHIFSKKEILYNYWKNMNKCILSGLIRSRELLTTRVSASYYDIHDAFQNYNLKI